MKPTTTYTDIQSMIGFHVQADFLQQDQHDQLREEAGSQSEGINCALCLLPILQSDEVDLHHPLPRSEGGTETLPVHKPCHVNHHSSNGHFREWGRIGGRITATSMRWALNLRNVRQHPAYELARSFYAAHYAH